jgi:hypothetical protein
MPLAFWLLSACKNSTSTHEFVQGNRWRSCSNGMEHTTYS